METEYPRSFYVHVVWNFLDDVTNKLEPKKIEEICYSLSGKESQRIVKTSLNYSVVWWFPGKDCEVLLEMLNEAGIEVASKTVI